MTFSIVGRSQDGRSWGVAVASKFLAVGNAVPAARAGRGAIATQASANVAWKRQALDLLAEHDAAETLRRLVEADEGRDHRQAGIVDRDGNGVTHTGSECLHWAGGVADRDVAIQGNILTGPEVVEAMKRAWDASHGQPLAHRLLAALEAGDAAGGDSRGRQAAAVLVVQDGAGYAGLDDVAVDLRVDDSPAPIPELRRLLELNDFYLTASTAQEKVPVDEALKAELDELARERGSKDFLAWVGTQNYEMRVAEDASWVDRRVLEILRTPASA